MKSATFDDQLAVKILNRMGKGLVQAQIENNNHQVSDLLEKVFNDLVLMYDVLHVNEIDVININ